ncbi:MAG: hypothetical protein GVY10_12420 [Verrucomicrobia bacterium]|jgi:uncharacterized PurR-regulated membrane protein YhhQ (DUF165 family)|nr:hypothetical protein [Verrucomicrobiota bacterium]
MKAAALYLVAVLLANLTATLFLPVEVLPGSGVLVSLGTLIFGLTFTQRDRMHRRGRPFVYKVIALSAVLTLGLLVSFRYLWGGWLAESFAAREWTWLAESALMLKESGWRVFAASFLAILIAESADTEVFHKYRERSFLVRVIRSNAVSIPVDSTLFNLVAFAGNPFFPALVLLQVIAGEILVKFGVGLAYALVLPRSWQREAPSPSLPGDVSEGGG